MVAKPLCPLYKNIIKPLDRARYPELRYIILNSVANMQKVHHLLDGYAQVYCHLDNDEAGENACVELQKRYGDKVIDHSHLYTGYKDLNEYLMSHKTRK